MPTPGRSTWKHMISCIYTKIKFVFIGWMVIECTSVPMILDVFMILISNYIVKTTTNK